MKLFRLLLVTQSQAKSKRMFDPFAINFEQLDHQYLMLWEDLPIFISRELQY